MDLKTAFCTCGVAIAVYMNTNGIAICEACEKKNHPDLPAKAIAGIVPEPQSINTITTSSGTSISTSATTTTTL